MTILLVEDDPFLIDIYKDRLTEQGFSIEVARKGEEIFDKLKKKIDLILLDIVLPDISGWDILEKIKSDNRFKKIPVIILSNIADKEEIDKGLKMGAEKYLVKAYYSPSQVLKEIKKVVSYYPI